MPRRLTSRDIAALSGVSQTTVSRVLRDDPYVSAKTRARVLKVLRETGYVPNAAAQRMRTNATGTFGLVVADLTNPFYPELVETLGQAIERSGNLMTLWIASEGHETAALDAIRSGQVDGVIYTTVTRRSTSLSVALQTEAPVVLLNRTLRVACDKVYSDNRAGAAAAAHYLLELGHERIALISGYGETSTQREREDAFRRALIEGGAPLDESLCVRGDSMHAAGQAEMLTLLDRGVAPTAVFCINDCVAFGAIDAARMRGLSIPDDLSVIGFDDVRMSSWASYNLTTVRQNVEEMSKQGVELLQGRIAGTAPRRFRHVKLPAELVVRGSTRPL